MTSKETEILEKRKNVDLNELWDEIGFHKPVAGFWYNITYQLIGIGISTVVMGYLIGFFYPWPDSLGMKDIAYGYFSLLFSLFDIGTGAVMSRFIPEVNIRDPKKMLHYIQYFIWYQMITGIIQTTIVSVYAIFYASKTTMAYTVWIMLIASTTQYPGFLGVFRNVLYSLQYFDKTKLLNFLTGTIMNTASSFFFVWFFKVWGFNHPEVGPVLGIAIGAAFGSYIDDFFGTWLSAYYFAKVLRPYGIRPRHCFQIEFTWEEIKPVLLYSLRVGAPGFITGFLNYFAWIMKVQSVPQITTIMFLAIVGGSMGDFFLWFGGTDIGPLVNESYMNNKPRLTQYYIGQDLRFIVFELGLFIPLVLVIREVMPIVYVNMNMAQYVIATVFILPYMIKAIFSKFFEVPWQVLNGASRPNWGIFTGILNSILNILITYLLYVHFALPKRLDFEGTVWLIYFWTEVPIQIVLNLSSYIFIHLKIVHIKIPIKQIALGMIIPSALTYGILHVIKISIFDAMYNSYGFFPALIPTILLILLIIFFGYIPLTGLFGGWDRITLEEFNKAAVMSGPSKFIVLPMAWLLNKFCKISPLHDKFGMYTKELERDAIDLLITKRIKREELREELMYNRE